jgi:uncharacterized protein YajQ (UPF0234 family)
MADPSFDVVSKVDRQEVDNAVKQAAKELAQRFDFRGTGTGIDEPRQSGKTYRIHGRIIEGISSEKAKEIGKVIRDEKLKGVQAQVQGDQLRVSGKKKDDLQAVIALLKGRDFGIALQFVNYR